MGHTIPGFIIAMGCLDNIVSLGLCDDEISISGFTIMEAPGMSPVNAEKIAAEQYGKGVTLLNAKKALAIKMVRNDFIGYLQAASIATEIADKVYDSSIFNAGIDMGLFSGYRGVKIHGVNSGRRGSLRKLKIQGVKCYPLAGGDSQISVIDIVDGVETWTNYPVTFVANKINTFLFPEPYTCQNKDVAVLVDNSEINFSSANITCLKGCHGVTNPCAWADGWDGTKEVKSEGFGIDVLFFCHCDYESLMCDLSAAYVGELVWTKWQQLVWDEQRKTNRFEAWTTYNRGDLPGYIAELESTYNAKYNEMIGGGLYNILKTYKDFDCLDCRGVRKVTNV